MGGRAWVHTVWLCRASLLWPSGAKTILMYSLSPLTKGHPTPTTNYFNCRISQGQTLPPALLFLGNTHGSDEMCRKSSNPNLKQDLVR